MRRYLQNFAILLALAPVMIVGCSSSASVPTPAAVSNPSGTVVVGTSPASISLSHPSGYTATISLPSTSDGSTGSIAVSLSTSLPSSATSPASMKRTPLTIGATLTPLLYVTLASTATVTFGSTPSFSFKLPSGTTLAAGSSAFIAFYDPAQSATGWLTVLGPGAVSGQTITFPGTTGTLTMKAGTTYTFMLFATNQAPIVTSAQCQPGVAAAPLPSPTPRSSSYIAVQFVLDKSAQINLPHLCPANIQIYIVSQNDGKYVTDAQGDTAALTSSAIPSLSFYGGTYTSGNVSQVFQLPNFNSGRVYMSNSALTITNSSYPAPWTTTSFAPVFDWFEYTSPAFSLPSPSLDINSTQIQMIGLDYTLQVNGQINGQSGYVASGLLPGFKTAAYNAASAQPWNTVMFSQWSSRRILGPNAVQYLPGGNPSLPGFVSTPTAGAFLDNAIQQAWNQWTAPSNCMQIKFAGNEDTIPAGTTVYGAVDPSTGNFVFYNPNTVTSCAMISSAPTSARVATLPSPFNTAYWVSTFQTAGGGCPNTGGTWFTGTSSALLQNGPFSASPTYATCVNNIQGSVSFPENKAFPNAAPTIGNIVSTAINRGLFSSTANTNQPACPGFSVVYQNSAPYLNLYAKALWTAVQQNLTPIAGSATPNQRAGVYAIPYDDQCSYSSNLTSQSAQSIIVTINGD